MSTIKSQVFSGVRINNKDAATGLYDITLQTDLITENVIKTGTVLVSFRQSNSGSGWMALPFALTNNYWVYSYATGSVSISNTAADMPNGVDFKIVAIEV
jgi:hypothetical protein